MKMEEWWENEKFEAEPALVKRFIDAYSRMSEKGGTERRVHLLR